MIVSTSGRGRASGGRDTQLALPLGVITGLALGFLALRLYMIGTMPVFMDEAYYWLWGQRPALSYFDHPPLSAWFLSLSSGFGWGLNFWGLGALRAPVVLSLFGDIWVIYLFTRMMPETEQSRYFWLTVLLFLATPIFAVMTSFATPDHVLIFFLLLGLYCFARFLRAWQPENQRGYRWLFAAGLCVGLATLAKYNGVLLGLGFAVFLVVSAKHRILLARWQTYATGALAAVPMIPVMVWNVQNGFASFGFIASGRHAGLPSGAEFEGIFGFALSIIVFLSPFLLPATFRFLRAPPGPTQEREFYGFGRVVVLVSTGVIAAISLLTTILFHWNMVAFVGILPFLGVLLVSRVALLAHLVYALVFLGIIYVNFALIPAATLFNQRDWSGEWSFGWQVVAERVEKAQAETGAVLVGATHYGPASQLAFALKNPDVLRFGDGVDQFFFWPDGEVGADAIIVADRWNPVSEEIRALFGEIELLERVPVIRFGRQVNVQRIYLATGYKGRG